MHNAVKCFVFSIVLMSAYVGCAALVYDQNFDDQNTSWSAVVTGDAIVFEDAINGVQAAKVAGAYCVGITSSFSSDELLAAGADETVPDLRSPLCLNKRR